MMKGIPTMIDVTLLAAVLYLAGMRPSLMSRSICCFSISSGVSGFGRGGAGRDDGNGLSGDRGSGIVVARAEGWLGLGGSDGCGACGGGVFRLDGGKVCLGFAPDDAEATDARIGEEAAFDALICTLGAGAGVDRFVCGGMLGLGGVVEAVDCAGIAEDAGSGGAGSDIVGFELDIGFAFAAEGNFGDGDGGDATLGFDFAAAVAAFNVPFFSTSVSILLVLGLLTTFSGASAFVTFSAVSTSTPFSGTSTFSPAFAPFVPFAPFFTTAAPFSAFSTFSTFLTFTAAFVFGAAAAFVLIFAVVVVPPSTPTPSSATTFLGLPRFLGTGTTGCAAVAGSILRMNDLNPVFGFPIQCAGFFPACDRCSRWDGGLFFGVFAPRGLRIGGWMDGWIGRLIKERR